MLSEMLRMLLNHPQLDILATERDGSFYIHHLIDPDVFEIIVKETNLNLNLQDSVSRSIPFYFILIILTL
jgi:hypothetical protein